MRALRSCDRLAIAFGASAVSLLALAVGGCDDDGRSSGAIVVFAAASLTDPFTELGDAFRAAHAGPGVTFNFASSSDLAAQIAQGAPADVFASADEPNMAKLTAGDGTIDPPVVFARNRLQVIVAPGNPLRIAEVADLADPGVIFVTAAPEVPIGGYTERVLASAGVEVIPRSYEENVKAIVTKVVLGEADAGIVYATDVTAAGTGAAGVEIPPSINVTASYPIAVPTGSAAPERAAEFVDFVLSADGQAILRSYGFEGP